MIRLLCALALVIWTGMANAQCRQALALGLDVSGSVDAREYRLQLGGLATALEDNEVREKLLAMPSAPVRLLIFEWSGPNDQALLVPWTPITSAATLDGVIETLKQVTRRDATPGTALGVAMRLGQIYLNQQPDCWKRTLDISGDGQSNLGPRPRDVGDTLEGSGITINGLVIGEDATTDNNNQQPQTDSLSAYYRAEVILGPDAFVMTALGFDDYARAMKQKLLRELDGMVFSQATPPYAYVRQ